MVVLGWSNADKVYPEFCNSARKSKNTQAVISPSKKAVKIVLDAYSVVSKPGLLTDEISVSID
jgi:hypothetical protein